MTGGAAKSILIVDDEPSIRLLCRINLELEGFVVREAGSLADARAELAEGDVGVVLLDVHVADENGLEFLAELRRDRPALKVALLTGSAELDVRDERPDAVISKPFAPELLAVRVRALLAEAVDSTT